MQTGRGGGGGSQEKRIRTNRGGGGGEGLEMSKFERTYFMGDMPLEIFEECQDSENVWFASENRR